MEINTAAAEIGTTAVEFGTAAAEFSTSVLLMRRKTNQSCRHLFTSSPSAVCIHISKFIIADCLIFNQIEFELIADSNQISCCGVRFLISYLKASESESIECTFTVLCGELETLCTYAKYDIQVPNVPTFFHSYSF
ncbi:hypothetical protein KY290_021763 [Solanum tuberosum]|uniref:Uncharacterized protein n=1 Tax=Solanum tuberosum TaxID=4113 RepID=A0ABQ7V2H0_SOLTU|nr:hypothetical protein KY289_020927 [Solanum tuberosum]KAH0758270.1 hypothetical protein KY290_021763 [Solanum tuberosum]